MSLLEKIVHTVKGVANDAFDSVQNPGVDARQSIRDLDEQLLKADQTLVEARAQAELLKGKKEKAEAEVAKWLQAATNAANKDDNLARECLTKKASATASLNAINESIASFQPTVTGLEKHISELRTKRDNFSNRADLIGVRSDVADVELRVAAITGGTGSSTSLAAQEEALAKKEAKANAATSVARERTGESLEARVAALNSGPSIEEELAALKSKK